MSEQPNVIRHGDWLVDETTGEIVDIVTEPQHDDTPFIIHDQASAEWVMSKLFDEEAEIAAIRKRREVLLSNLDAMEKVHQRRADWLRYRFGGELEDHAAIELDGKKGRSIKTPFGTLSFRKKAAKLVVEDEAAALDWAKSNRSDAVKVTEKVLVSLLPQTGAVPGTRVEPEQDTFSVKTGVL